MKLFNLYTKWNKYHINIQGSRKYTNYNAENISSHLKHILNADIFIYFSCFNAETKYIYTLNRLLRSITNILSTKS